MTPADKTTSRSDGAPPPTAPSISLPTGGGAIRGIGEKFAANPVTGTGSTTVPLALSPGRSGFGPQLALSYDSGTGNGVFGFGWNLSLPSITRKTDKGLPNYRDVEESDVFMLSGAEDLVPIPVGAGSPALTPDGYRIQRYRPRIEGLFARIERWTKQATGEIHWRSISRDNITTLYGKTFESRVADPGDPQRIFSWLICESYDDKGNVIVYEYAAENDDNVDRAQANERNRVRTGNRYLKRIKYGNRTPNRDANGNPTDPAQLSNGDWMFEVVFDYDEDHYEALAPDPALPEAEQHQLVRAAASPGLPWTVRPDPFSSYRAGFEGRTYRRCRRVLMFHRFDELGDEPYLVRSTEFDYADFDYAQPSTIEAELAHPGSTRFASFIRSVTQSGFVRDETRAVLERNGVTYVTYLKRSLPPLEFEYSKARIQDDIRALDAGSLENLPSGLDGAAYQWIDLDGEGVSGILTEQADTWFYKPNLGDGRFGPLEVVAAKPSLAALNIGRQQLIDLAGDGQLDLVALAGPTPGFYERTHDEDWEALKPFTSLPNISWDDPNLRLVDLTGDGHADVLIAEDGVFTWYPSLAEAGFGLAEKVHQAVDEEQGPRLLFADGVQSVYLADMSGDGLSDLLRIRNGDVCYWPNLGYSRFGAKVTMDHAPRFDAPDMFDQRRVRLADIDGTGVTDIIYLGRDGVRLYFNESGNRWSAPRRLRQFPRVDNIASVMTADLLGNGTACLVWSSPLPGDVRRRIRYIDLMGGQKPHLLVKTVNNLGAETHVHYVSSTHFYLKDKAAGTPWVTKLPFPVHVVERVETYDHISRNRFVTRYAYHHGYFDGVEREFRGFGMVEQFDTESFAAFTEGGTLPEATNLDATSHVPPVHTKTWFHTGVYVDRDHVSDFFAGLIDGHDRGEYYREPAWRDDDAEARKRLLDDTILPDGLTAEEEREAARSLKGMMLRQEVYALEGVGQDGDYPNGHPYTVAEQNFTVRLLQARGDNRHAVFFTHAREAISYHYERNPTDPRIAHALTLEVDGYGNVLQEAAIGYGRRQSDMTLSPEDQAKQNQIFITYTENRVTNPIIENDAYRTPLPCETRTYELTGLILPAGHSRFTLAEILNAGPGALPIAYEQSTLSGVLQKRLIEQVRTLYRPDALGVAQNDPLALLPLGTVESLALPGESYKLAFTPGLLDQVYVRSGQKLLPANLADVLEGGGADGGGYVDLDGDGHWWIPSGRIFLSPASADTPAQELAHARQHFFLPHRYRDPFHTNQLNTETIVTFDDHRLLVVETRDALSNTVQAQNDYRVLAPRLMTDPNGNRSEVAFDALGMVVSTAVQGKLGQNLGDLLEDFDPDPPLAALQAFVADPQGQAASLLGKATTRMVYDLDRYQRSAQPPFAATLARETHFADPGGAPTKIQISFSYSDGFGREIQQKIQAERGDAPQRGPNVTLPSGDVQPGALVRDADGNPVQADTPQRWVGSGRTVFNNKGKPVRQYEPFFSSIHLYEAEREMTDTGVSPILFYDPVERVVATLHPNHSWEKVIFDPWQQTSHDVNDTVRVADPRTDTDVGDFFRRLPDAEYLPTWHVLRTDPAHAAEFAKQYPDSTTRTNETKAATKTQAHAATPTTAYFDTLGRPFLTVAHNRVVCPGHALDGTEDRFHTRVELDIEGNQREVIDAKDRIVMRYDYDMLGNRIHQASMEAGERWMLNDVAGQPLYAWDSRSHQFRTAYDQLRRPTASFLREGADAELQVGRTVYGETRPNPEAKNLRGQVVQLFDQAGIIISDDYDFKGNPLSSQRQLAALVDPQGTRIPAYKTTVDWSGAVQLEADTYTSRTTYDALNRPTELTTPHTPAMQPSVIRPSYNEANLLEKVDVNLRGAAVVTPFVTDIDYDAKGQRTLIAYGNGVRTTYEYDPLTFRLTRLTTTRPAGLNGLATQLFKHAGTVQDLRYTYDPAGNITRIADDALPVIVHDNQQVAPVCDYTYDAIYRLVEAEGREHIGQTAFDFEPPNGNVRDYPFAGSHAHPNDVQALRHYTERYAYDEVGNFEQLIHQAANGNWTRAYTYTEPSLMEPGKQNNRLSSTSVHPNGNQPIVEPYTYDAHGNMTSMPHLPKMAWDIQDQLQATSQQVVTNGGTPETTYYVYDAAGQRARKVTERQTATGQTPTRMKERIYLGGFEIYREYENNGDTVNLERETLHIMDDQQRIALVETRTLGIEAGIPEQLIRYQFGNHLGSASLELDNQGQIISYEEYYPYGSTSYQAGRSAAEVSLKRYRYTAMERDEENGLNYHSARYYAAWLGRWVSCDPIGIEGDINIFVYVGNSPILLVDSNGKSPNTTSLPSNPKPEHPDWTSKRTSSQLTPNFANSGWTYKSMPGAVFFMEGPGSYFYSYDSGGSFYNVDNKKMSIIVMHGVPILNHLGRQALFEVPEQLLSDNPGEVSTPGPRWNAQGPRQFYRDPRAVSYAMLGYDKTGRLDYSNYADVIESEHGCAGCHVQFLQNGPPTNSQLDLNNYNRWAIGLGVARRFAEAATMHIAGMTPRTPPTPSTVNNTATTGGNSGGGGGPTGGGGGGGGGNRPPVPPGSGGGGDTPGGGSGGGGGGGKPSSPGTALVLRREVQQPSIVRRAQNLVRDVKEKAGDLAMRVYVWWTKPKQ